MGLFAKIAEIVQQIGAPAGAPRYAIAASAILSPDGNTTLVDPVQQTSKLKKAISVASADGAIEITHGTVVITKSSAAALTLASPTAGRDDGIEIDFVSTTAQAHTVTCTAGFGGGTTSRDVATFGGAINDGFRIVAYNGVWYAKDTRNVTFA